MAIYFTADLHFGHDRILTLQGRPFSTIEEHDKALVENWNSMVGPKDDVYILGDLFFKSGGGSLEILKKLKGHKHLIKGNHDKRLQAYIREEFESIQDRLEIHPIIDGEKQKIFLSHYVHLIWNKAHKGAWHLFGHSHGNLSWCPNKSMDVGADTNNFYPYSLGEIKEAMDAMPPYVPIDHHKPKVVCKLCGGMGAIFPNDKKYNPCLDCGGVGVVRE